MVILGLLMAACVGVWLLSLSLTIVGTWMAHRRMSSTPPHLDAPFGLYPVSVLKPLKGADPGLTQNLDTFFHLDYPCYELIFSVADANDPACRVVRALMKRYPKISARLLIGSVEAGPNPKVNNLIRSYEQALYDILLISDSNIRVTPDYLKRLVGHLDNGVGMITAVVAGRDAQGLGGHLESLYLNTFYARWMILAEAFGKPCVVGKSMLFRKSVAQRFGGMRALARYLAEDYMAGEAVRKLGLDVIVMSDPVHQHLGRYSVKEFWSRHLRWGRIRKSQAPLPFLMELVGGMICSGFLGAIALSYFFPTLSWVDVFSVHLALWSACDLFLASWLEPSMGKKILPAWLMREILAPFLWLHTALGNRVLWRGQSLKLAPGGLLDLTSERTAK